MFCTYAGKAPTLLGSNIYIDRTAVLIGAVVIGDGVIILPQVVIRADNDPIHIGAGSNIQEGVILHTDTGFPLYIGCCVTVGHQAMLHGCYIDDNTIIGISSVVLNGARVGKNCLIGAKALVLEHQQIAEGSLVLGAPAKVKRALTQAEIIKNQESALHYQNKIPAYQEAIWKTK